MPLPLQALTYARMADVSPSGTAIKDLLDAIYTACSAANDYRGTALPSTHVWTWARYQNAGTTEAVYATPPAGTPMTRTPALLWAGRIANAGTFASPDTSQASMLQVGINKLSGSYSDWTAASPFTSGNWSGYWRAAATAANATGTIVRVFISQEAVFVQLIQSATVQYWTMIGAIVEPYDDDTTLSGESDNRLYGMLTSGAAQVSASWLQGTNAMFSHSTTNGQYHGCVFTPGSGVVIPGGRRRVQSWAPQPEELQTPSGVYVGDIMEFGKSTADVTNAGNRMGTIRGAYLAGKVQSGRYLRSGSTDLYHFVSVDTSAADDGLMLKAVA